MVTTPAGIDQELVVHLFAPLDGPHAETAWTQVQAVWTQVRQHLEATQLVPIAGAPEVLPDERIEVGPDRVVACAQNRGANVQIIARRFHDVLNVSLVLAPPLDRIGRPWRTSIAPGWRDFERWWRSLSVDGVDAAIGLAMVFQIATDAVDGLLPQRMETLLPALGSSWEPRSVPEATDWDVWEADSPDDSARRAFLVAGPERCYGTELTTWTWSDGGVGLPPLARYLMHAAKVRYQYRLLESSANKIRALSVQARALVDDVKPLLYKHNQPEGQSLTTDLSVAQGDLEKTVSDLKAMKRTVEIACANMARALPKPFARDEIFAIGLQERIADETYYLQNTLTLVQESLQRLRAANQITGEPARARRSALAAEPIGPTTRLLPRRAAQMRFAFAVDIVSYGRLNAPDEQDAQQRLSDLVEHVIASLGYEIAETERELRGDQVLVLIPSDADIPSALATLIDALRSRAAADNRKYASRMRVRAAASIGVFSRGSIGIAAGGTQMGRLIDAEPLREALTRRPESDVVVLISKWLHEETVAREYEQLLPFRFEQCRVQSKEYDKTAWLWSGDQ